MTLRKKLHNELVDLKGAIRVFCRVRYVDVCDGVNQIDGKQIAASDSLQFLLQD